MGKKAVSTKTPAEEAADSVPAKPGRNMSQSINSPVEQILCLQRTVGNRAVQGLFNSDRVSRLTIIQPKLTIGQPNDIYEEEADRLADRVMRMPEPRQSLVQRQAECPECEEEEEEEELIQSKPVDNRSSAVTPALRSNIQSLKSGGQRLSESARAFFEPRFGRDFSSVRVHTGTGAAEAAKSINAKAFTKGADIVFGAGEYSPGTEMGKRLLAHELSHVVQQTDAKRLQTTCNGARQPQAVSNLAGSVNYIVRQCNPGTAALPWAQRVNSATGMAAGAARHQCMADLISEALSHRYTVHQSTNNHTTINAAIAANAYQEINSFQDINFDANLNRKTGNPNDYGHTTFRTSPGGGNIRIFIILGPRALNTIGPQFTEMAYKHEDAHAMDFLIQWATVGPGPHAATPAEELAIYTDNFENYFLGLWQINNTAPCGFRLAENFSRLFDNYNNQTVTIAERDTAFTNIQDFYNAQVRHNRCNMMKFKIWLQGMQNARSAADLLVIRLNGLPGLGLVRGTSPATHLTCPTPCP